MGGHHNTTTRRRISEQHHGGGHAAFVHQARLLLQRLKGKQVDVCHTVENVLVPSLQSVGRGVKLKRCQTLTPLGRRATASSSNKMQPSMHNPTLNPGHAPPLSQHPAAAATRQ